MHETSLLQSLVEHIITLAEQNKAKSVTRVGLKVGAGVHIAPDHLREHFYDIARGTIAEQAHIDVDIDTDEYSENAADIILQTMEMEDGKP